MRCRKLQLTADNRRNDGAEIEAFARLLKRNETHEDDWQLWDPDHPETLIWAKELARRYRYQTQPRPVRNNLRKWL